MMLVLAMPGAAKPHTEQKEPLRLTRYRTADVGVAKDKFQARPTIPPFVLPFGMMLILAMTGEHTLRGPGAEEALTATDKG
jgi:hypothetical protein